MLVFLKSGNPLKFTSPAKLEPLPNFKSNCLICTCDGWLPIPVGKVQDFNSLAEVWSSPIAQTLQADIDNKKYTWCAVEHCGIKQHNIVRDSYELAINIDESCNLHCPSCRRNPIMHTSGPEFDNKLNDLHRIIQWLDNFDEPICIILSGNGDPLASAIIRPLINSYQPKTTQTFRLFTNGLLIKKQLIDSKILPNVSNFLISVDAGSSAVYANVRRGGNWQILLENFDFLDSIGVNDKVQLNFAVQKNNFRDLENFVAVCQKYGFIANIHQLDDWGTWATTMPVNPDAWTIVNGTFEQHNVLSTSHSDYKECVNILQKIATYPGRIKFSNNLVTRMSA
jgi:sulfatase maturation enzyme AslB (radical SAM superfamily)